MATTLPMIGQAVVTDPGTSGASGYTLVAWSPAVSAEDRAHFARVPQVSDYLHLENAARVFFSFHRLPGGAWGFGKRFARGTRRGSYNRIVVYTLILPAEVMEALEWEPWLLPACRFRAEGAERSFQDLTLWEGEIPRALPDLQVIPPADGEARRRELLESRHRFLEERWERDGLQGVLAQALGVLEGGSGLLLPQGTEHEQLLALVWSALPRRDRGAIGWTTHLAPGGLDLFHLANAPSPDETRASAGPSWSLLREAARRPGSLAVAEALASGTPPWPQVAGEWYEVADRSGLSLIGDGAQVNRWIAWVKRGGPPPGGYTSIPDLEAYFAGHAIDRSSLTDPWESPVALLALSARTAANLQRAGHGAEAGAKVYRLLVARELARALLVPQRFAEILGLHIDAGILEAALGLCLRPVLSEQDKARLLALALDAAQRAGDEALAGRIAAGHVVPTVAAAPAVAPLLGEHLDLALGALRASPEGLVEALRTWREALYDRAVEELRRWLVEAPQAAIQAAGSWDEDAAQQRPSIVGLAELLASRGIAAESWLPFALAEAAALDHSFSRLSDAELRACGGPVAAVAEALHGRGRRADASALARNWLKQVAKIPWGGLPQEAIRLLDLLSETDRGAVTSVWTSKLARIKPAPEEEAVFARFRDRLLADPKLRRRFDLSEVSAGMREGRLTFPEGAEKVLALVAQAERGEALLEVLADALPYPSQKRLEVLFELVLSPRLLPAARRLVQEKLFWPALQQAGSGLFWVLPPVDDLARRGGLLLRVLRRAGELWQEDRFTCYDRLKEALRLGRFDAVAAFLHGTASVRPPFLEALASRDGDQLLLAGLRQATRDPVACWDLRLFLHEDALR